MLIRSCRPLQSRPPSTPLAAGVQNASGGLPRGRASGRKDYFGQERLPTIGICVCHPRRPRFSSLRLGRSGGVLDSWGAPLVIDEVQRSPELLLAIKARVDRQRVAGGYLLTGSANVLALPKVAEALAGRMVVLTPYLFSQEKFFYRTRSTCRLYLVLSACLGTGVVVSSTQKALMGRLNMEQSSAKRSPSSENV